MPAPEGGHESRLGSRRASELGRDNGEMLATDRRVVAPGAIERLRAIVHEVAIDRPIDFGNADARAPCAQHPLAIPRKTQSGVERSDPIEGGAPDAQAVDRTRSAEQQLQ